MNQAFGPATPPRHHNFAGSGCAASDRHLVQQLGHDPRSVAGMLAKAISAAQAKSWATGTPAALASDAHAQAKTAAYNFNSESAVVDDHGGKAERLDAVYDRRALPVVREQLSKAGVRLAGLLNAVLK